VQPDLAINITVAVAEDGLDKLAPGGQNRVQSRVTPAASSCHPLIVLIPLLLKNAGCDMTLLRKFWVEQDGQDIAEYAVMLAVILVLVVGTIRLVGSNANNVFSSAASSIQ